MLVQMDFRSVLSTVFRQMWKFLLVFVPVVILGLLYVLTATRYHESSAKLLVKFGQDARPEMVMGTANSLTAEEKRGMVQSNVNILNSRDIIEELIKKVGVAKIYPKLAEQDMSEEAKLDAAVRGFARDFSVVTESDAGVIKVSIFHPKPEVGQELITSLVDIFIRRQAEIYGNPQTKVLQEQANVARTKLDEATKALADFKMQTGIASIDEELTLLLQQRGDLTGYLSRREFQPEGSAASGVSADPSDYEGGEKSQAAANTKAETSIAPLPARIAKAGDSSRFPVIEDSQRRIDELRAREAELLLTYRPDSTAVRAVRKNIAIETEALNRSVDALNEQIADLDRQIAAKQEHRSEYDELQRDVTGSQEAFDIAQERYRAAEVNNDLTERNITRISVVEQPATSFKPTKPKRMMVLLMSVIIGLTLGLALSLGTEIADSTFSRPEQLAATLRKPVLASFPNWSAQTVKMLPPPQQWRMGVKDIIKSRKLPSVYAEDSGLPKHLPTDELIGLYQAIKAKDAADGSVVNLVSCHAGEGATTIGRELCETIAGRLGQSVLLVTLLQDAKALHRPAASLADAASGRATLKDALTPFEHETRKLSHAYLLPHANDDFLISGTEKLEEILKELRRNFSTIVIATPAIASKSAVVGLGKLADSVIVVIEAERTRAPVVKQALNAMTSAGLNIVGTILNKQIYYIPGWLYGRL